MISSDIALLMLPKDQDKMEIDVPVQETAQYSDSLGAKNVPYVPHPMETETSAEPENMSGKAHRYTQVMKIHY